MTRHMSIEEINKVMDDAWKTFNDEELRWFGIDIYRKWEGE